MVGALVWRSGFALQGNGIYETRTGKAAVRWKNRSHCSVNLLDRAVLADFDLGADLNERYQEGLSYCVGDKTSSDRVRCQKHVVGPKKLLCRSQVSNISVDTVESDRWIDGCDEPPCHLDFLGLSAGIVVSGTHDSGQVVTLDDVVINGRDAANAEVGQLFDKNRPAAPGAYDGDMLIAQEFLASFPKQSHLAIEPLPIAAVQASPTRRRSQDPHIGPHDPQTV